MGLVSLSRPQPADDIDGGDRPLGSGIDIGAGAKESKNNEGRLLLRIAAQDGEINFLKYRYSVKKPLCQA